MIISGGVYLSREVIWTCMEPSDKDILLIFSFLMFTVRSRVELNFNIFFPENFLKHQKNDSFSSFIMIIMKAVGCLIAF